MGFSVRTAQYYFNLYMLLAKLNVDHPDKDLKDLIDGLVIDSWLKSEIFGKT